MPVYKNEKLGTWFCKFYYTDWQGIKRQKMKKGFLTKREAQAFEREFINKAHASVDMTFGNLTELYMADCKSRLKPTTYESKKYIVELKILPFFRELPLNAITPAMVRKWQNDWISNEKKYSPTYLKTINTHLTAIFNYAMRYYKLPENPVRLCGAMGKKAPDVMHFWTLQEFSKFIAVFDDNLFAKFAFQLLFWTGIRSGELLALTYEDIDVTAQIININKNYARLNRKDLIMEPKTQKSKRIVTIPPFLAELAEVFLKSHKQNVEKRLFPVTSSYLQCCMKKGCAASCVKKIRVHDLRHSHASLLIEMGFSPLLISERLGHEDIQTTLRTYSHLYPDKQSEVAAKLQNLNEGLLVSLQ